MVFVLSNYFKTGSGQAALIRLAMHALSSAGSAENHCTNALQGLSNRSLLSTQLAHSLKTNG